MIAPSARGPNLYGGGHLDRASARRTDAVFIQAALADPTTVFVPVAGSKTLVDAGRRAALLPQRLRDGGEDTIFLGLRDGRAIFAELLAADAPAPDGFAFEELRIVGSALPEAEASILAHARGMAIWRGRHRFCGLCGSPTEPQNAGNQLHCTGCGASHFPRTDPAVIMLVIHPDGDRALVGRAPRFPATMYSTLAGFAEPGESMEDTVRREVFEEVGVPVGEVFYHSSQPWPFPTSVMLGFYAQGLDAALAIDPAELLDARWCARPELADPASHGFALPPRDSIARRMIEDWVAA